MSLNCEEFNRLSFYHDQEMRSQLTYTKIGEECVCRRLAKSALVLIPLFGVPYMLFLGAHYHYIDITLELVKLYFEMTFNSFNVSMKTLI